MMLMYDYESLTYWGVKSLAGSFVFLNLNPISPRVQY